MKALPHQSAHGYIIWTIYPISKFMGLPLGVQRPLSERPGGKIIECQHHSRKSWIRCWVISASQFGISYRL